MFQRPIFSIKFYLTAFECLISYRRKYGILRFLRLVLSYRETTVCRSIACEVSKTLNAAIIRRRFS